MREPRTEGEAWRDQGILKAVRDGKPLSAMQRARIEEWYEARAAVLHRFWAIDEMEGSDGHRYLRRDRVSAAIQGLPDPALSDPVAE